MAEWQRVRFGSIAKTNQCTYSPKENWQFVNYLDTGNITMNRIDEIQYINTLTDNLPSRARRKVNNNSILYSTVRPNQLHYGHMGPVLIILITLLFFQMSSFLLLHIFFI